MSSALAIDVARFSRELVRTESVTLRTLKRNFLTLFSGALLGRIITLAALPFVTRLYTPSDFGELAVFSAAVAFAAPLLSLRFPVLLPVLHSEKTALHVLALSGFTVLIGLLIISAAMLVAGLDDYQSDSIRTILRYPLLFLLACSFAALWDVATQWSTRKMRFKSMAVDQVTSASGETFVKIALPMLSYKDGALMMAYIVGHGAVAWQSFTLLLHDLRLSWRLISLRGVLASLRLFRSVPILRMPSQLILVIAAQAPIVLFMELFGAGDSGQLAMAMLVTNAPVALIGGAAGQAYLAELRAAGRSNSRKIYSLTWRFLTVLFLVSMLPSALLFFFGEAVFKVVFGGQWGAAGNYAGMLAPVLVAQFVSVPIMHVLTFYGLHGRFLSINLMRLIAICAASGAIVYLQLDVGRALLLLSVVLATHYLLSSLRVMLVVRDKARITS